MKRWMMIWAILCTAPAWPAAGEPLQVLILTGYNNHDWAGTTAVMREYLTADGRFEVTVSEQPHTLTAEDLAAYDVLLSNWNAYGVAAPDWPEPLRAAVLAFVEGGKGFVVVHAGSSSFWGWDGFPALTGATWADGQTSHGPPHQFEVEIVAPDHPVTSGLAAFTITDELWLNPGVHEDAQTLAVAEGQPVALATAYGEGRGFTLLLGHDANFMQNEGFRTLLLRGVEWAATGNMRGAPDLTAVAAWTYGQPRTVLLAAQQAALRQPESYAAAFADLLAGEEATLDARRFACEMLALTGGAAQVPVLAGLLADEDLALAALQALTRIPDEAAAAALRAALADGGGPARASLIHALGLLGDTEAVPLLIDALPAPEAMTALGLIGSAEALAALLALQDQGVPDAHAADWANALLAAALTQRDAEAIQPLLRPGRPTAVRTAALIGLARILGDQADQLLAAALRGDDPELHAAALTVLRQTGDARQAQALLADWSRLAPPLQAGLFNLMAELKQPVALPAATEAVTGDDEAVRHAALAVLAAVGDATSVPVLTGLLAPGQDALNARIVAALAALRPDAAREAQEQAVRTAEPFTQLMLAQALANRAAVRSVPLFLELAAGTDPEVQRVAVRALRTVVAPGEAAAVAAFLQAHAAEDALRPEVRNALQAIVDRATE